MLPSATIAANTSATAIAIPMPGEQLLGARARAAAAGTCRAARRGASGHRKRARARVGPAWLGAALPRAGALTSARALALVVR